MQYSVNILCKKLKLYQINTNTFELACKCYSKKPFNSVLVKYASVFINKIFLSKGKYHLIEFKKK